jgi:hypothetical protein
MPEVIGSWRDLRNAEERVLAAVREHRYGAHLFLVDPPRFLGEAGFSVTEAFTADIRALPGIRPNLFRAYELVAAGQHPICRTSITITKLGLPRGLGEPK